MGNAGCTQKQREAVYKQLEQEYIIEEHPLYKDSEQLKLLSERTTAKNYLLRIITTNSDHQAKHLQKLLQNRVNQEQPRSVMKLDKYLSYSVDYNCGGIKIFYLIFAMNHAISLSSQIGKRCVSKKYFSEKELIEGMENLVGGLIWLRKFHLGDKIVHSNIFNKTVYYSCEDGQGNFQLGDPIVFPLPPGVTEKYPSPQKLMLLRNCSENAEEFDSLTSDVFSCAMCILEASLLGKGKKIYEKTMINYDILRQNIQRSPYSKLREILSDLLLGTVADRRRYIHKIESGVTKEIKIKLLSAEKRKDKSRSKSKSRSKGRKITLTKNRSQQHLTCTTLPTANTNTNNCLSEVHSNTNININKSNSSKSIGSQNAITNHINFEKSKVHFNYINGENNPPQMVFQPPKFQIQNYTKKPKEGPAHNIDLFKYEQIVSRIDYDFTTSHHSIQEHKKKSELVYEKPYITQIQSFVQQSKQPQDKLVTEHSFHDVSGSHSHIYAEQTHQTQESHLNSSLFKGSLEGIVQEFKELQKNRESQTIINHASYGIAESKIQAPSVQSRSKQSIDLQQDLQPVQNSTSYIVNLQGTQLQVLSNLIIPEEAASKEQSLMSSRQVIPKGQFTTQKMENGGKYVGYMMNKMRNGLGTYYYQEGGFYEGNWKDNKMNGFGKLFYESGSLAYEGMWFMDEFHGRGKIFNDEPKLLKQPFNYKNFEDEDKYWLSYEGDFVQDEKEGYGKLTFSNGQFYKGQFKNGKPSGKGMFNGLQECLNGIWLDGQFVKKI